MPCHFITCFARSSTLPEGPRGRRYQKQCFHPDSLCGKFFLSAAPRLRPHRLRRRQRAAFQHGPTRHLGVPGEQQPHTFSILDSRLWIVYGERFRLDYFLDGFSPQSKIQNRKSKIHLMTLCRQPFGMYHADALGEPREILRASDSNQPG